MTNNKDKWLRALQAKGIRTTQDEVGRAGRHRAESAGKVHDAECFGEVVI